MFHILSKKNGSFMLMLIALIMACIITVLSPLIFNEHLDNEHISTKMVVKALSNQGIKLVEYDDKYYEEYIILDQYPRFFHMWQSDSFLLIYEFSSLMQRVEAERVWAEKKGVSGYANAFAYPIMYPIKNVMIEYHPPLSAAFYAEYMSIREVAFALNDSPEIVFQGRGDNWAVTYTVRYYENHFMDESNRLHVDTYHIDTGTLEYIGENDDDIPYIDYTLEIPSGGSSGSGLTLNENNKTNLGEGGGNGARPTADAKILFSVSWNDQSESITLSAQQ